jgi:hypothetical protein
MLSKTLNSEKLFYSQYLYKLHIRTPLSHVMRSHPTRGVTAGALNTLKVAMGNNDTIKVGRFKTAYRSQIEDCDKIIEHLKGKQSEFKVRCEMYSLIIYTNNLSLLDQIAKDTSIDTPCVLWAPVPGSETFLSGNINTIVSKKPTAYEYKVTLKYGSSSVHKTALAAWVRNNPDKAKAGSTVLRNLENDYYVGGNYIYVKNTSCLSIIEMIVGSGIGKIEKIVYINDIDK